MPKRTMSFVLHTFRPSETIDAVIRLLGRHNLSHEELIPLRAEFNRMNDSTLPRPGMTMKIPLPTASNLKTESSSIPAE